MVKPPARSNVQLQSRLSALKFRLSAKKIEASTLFADIISDNDKQHRLQDQLELIRDILKETQKKPTD